MGGRVGAAASAAVWAGKLTWRPCTAPCWLRADCAVHHLLVKGLRPSTYYYYWLIYLIRCCSYSVSTNTTVTLSCEVQWLMCVVCRRIRCVPPSSSLMRSTALLQFDPAGRTRFTGQRKQSPYSSFVSCSCGLWMNKDTNVHTCTFFFWSVSGS